MIDNLNNSKIIICDDTITNVMLLSALLESEGFTNVHFTTKPEELIKLVRKEHDYDLLLLDIEMPVLDGFQVMEELLGNKLVDEYFPILILTGRQDAATRNRALSAGAADFINKPFGQTEVVLRVRNLLKVRAAYRMQSNLAHVLEKKVEERTRQLSEATDSLVRRLARAGELRDNETGFHVIRVGKYAQVLAKAYGLSDEVTFLIERAAPLHDLGKIGIPDNILLKPGRLNEEERIQMNEHTTLGAELLCDHDSPLMKLAASIALTHHERWDGTGYPNKLKGEVIPVEGRITAICDVFDALVTVRPYKDAWSIEKAVYELGSSAGTHFDPDLVRMFVENLEAIMRIRDEYNDGPSQPSVETVNQLTKASSF